MSITSLPLTSFLLCIGKTEPVCQQLSINTKEGTEQQEPGRDSDNAESGVELTLGHS